MGLNRGQITLLVFAVVFFSLQFVPHHFPGTGFLFDLTYTLSHALALFVVIVATLIGFANWVSKRHTGEAEDSRRWFIACLAMTVAAVGLTLASKAYAKGLPVGSFVLEFESDIWRGPRSEDGSSSDISDRQKMLGSALERIPIGSEKSDVLNLFGQPVEFSKPSKLIYRLGPDRGGFGIDSQWLTVHLDGSGRVSAHELWED